ncbi:hypothetical protein, partial [Calothrix parietina]
FIITIKLIYFNPSPKNNIFWAIFIRLFLTFNISGIRCIGVASFYGSTDHYSFEGIHTTTAGSDYALRIVGYRNNETGAVINSEILNSLATFTPNINSEYKYASVSIKNPTFSGTPLFTTSPTFQSTLNITQSSSYNIGINLSTAAGNASAIKFSNNSSLDRWQIVKTADTESGSNAGSNFAINRYNNAGSYLNTPLSINRASGNVSINGGLTVNGQFTVTGGVTPPDNTSSAGTYGSITFDSNYLYICIGANSWRRVALSTF